MKEDLFSPTTTIPVCKALSLSVALVAAAVLTSAGCKKGPPTEKAPPTLKNLDRTDNGANQDDEDDTEGEADEAPAPARQPKVRWSRPAGRANTNTINGHPEGPDPAKFNAVVRSAYPKANECFASRIQALGKGPHTLNVRISVANNGSVREARIAGGVKDAQVRSCVLSVFRGLKFPAYQGPEVSQVVPITVVQAQ